MAKWVRVLSLVFALIIFEPVPAAHAADTASDLDLADYYVLIQKAIAGQNQALHDLLQARQRAMYAAELELFRPMGDQLLATPQGNQNFFGAYSGLGYPRYIAAISGYYSPWKASAESLLLRDLRLNPWPHYGKKLGPTAVVAAGAFLAHHLGIGALLDAISGGAVEGGVVGYTINYSARVKAREKQVGEIHALVGSLYKRLELEERLGALLPNRSISITNSELQSQSISWLTTLTVAEKRAIYIQLIRMARAFLRRNDLLGLVTSQKSPVITEAEGVTREGRIAAASAWVDSVEQKMLKEDDKFFWVTEIRSFPVDFAAALGTSSSILANVVTRSRRESKISVPLREVIHIAPPWNPTELRLLVELADQGLALSLDADFPRAEVLELIPDALKGWSHQVLEASGSPVVFDVNYNEAIDQGQILVDVKFVLRNEFLPEDRAFAVRVSLPAETDRAAVFAELKAEAEAAFGRLKPPTMSEMDAKSVGDFFRKLNRCKNAFKSVVAFK